jgi:hypothetical protein
MVGVIVRGQYTDDPHSVNFHGVDEGIHVVGRINEETLTCRTITDCVDEIDHLTRKIVVLSEVAPGEQLAEIEPVVAHADEPTRAYP